MVDDDVKQINMTSISVTKPVLRWVTMIKSLLEYYTERPLTNNEALGLICWVADYHLAKDIGMTNDDILTFLNKKLKTLNNIDPDAEINSIFDDVKSYGLFTKS